LNRQRQKFYHISCGGIFALLSRRCRYRYDTETGLYYLQSRYYNPEWGRFINADEIAAVTGELLSSNMFAYCKNNAVNMEDSDGFRPVSMYGDDDIDLEGYYEKARDREREKNPKRPSDAKKREKREIDSAFGKRGTKEREQKSEELHKDKKKNGDRNYNNKKYGDLVDGNYNKTSIGVIGKIGLVGAGTVIIIGTIIEDIATGGVGIADDGVTITGGAGLIIKAF
jgi:RHS repeat-associated protein